MLVKFEQNLWERYRDILGWNFMLRHQYSKKLNNIDVRLTTSLLCYGKSNINVTPIITNQFHIHLIQLWWSFFQIFVNAEVVNAQTQLGVIAPKNSVQPPCGLGTEGFFLPANKRMRWLLCTSDETAPCALQCQEFRVI